MAMNDGILREQYAGPVPGYVAEILDLATSAGMDARLCLENETKAAVWGTGRAL